MKIEGSIVLVTGGASGIGLSITEHFISLKAFVFICDLQENLGKEVESKYPSNCKFIKCNITNDDEVQTMFKTIKQDKGRIDTVVNSAGISVAELTV